MNYTPKYGKVEEFHIPVPTWVCTNPIPFEPILDETQYVIHVGLHKCTRYNGDPAYGARNHTYLTPYYIDQFGNVYTYGEYDSSRGGIGLKALVKTPPKLYNARKGDTPLPDPIVDSLKSQTTMSFDDMCQFQCLAQCLFLQHQQSTCMERRLQELEDAMRGLVKYKKEHRD
jgi:hypothetical protein